VLDSSFATLRFHKCALLYTIFYRICIFMSIFRLVMFYHIFSLYGVHFWTIQSTSFNSTYLYCYFS